MASNAENVSIWWRHHGIRQYYTNGTCFAVQQVVLWQVIYQYPTLQGSDIHTKTRRPNIARDIILAAILRFNWFLITKSSAAKYKHSLFINVQQLVRVEHMTTLLLLTICYLPPVANVALQPLLWVSTKLKYHFFFIRMERKWNHQNWPYTNATYHLGRFPYPEPVYTGWSSVHLNTTGMPLVDPVYTGIPPGDPAITCRLHWNTTGKT